MARLFIRHKPVEAIAVRVPPFTNCNFRVARRHVAGIECQYICFVNDGHCYAARAMTRNANNDVITFSCVPFDDNPSGQEMILADMILN